MCERERGAPARGVCAWVSDTEGRAGRSAGGREQPARGGSVPAWSGPIRSCVSEGIQSGGRAGCALRRERRQRGASSGRRAAQAAAPARPALRAAGAATAAAPPPATAPPAAVSRPGTERPTLGTEVSPGLAAAAARDPPSPRAGPGPGCGAQADAAGPGRPGRRLGPGRAFRSLGRPAPAASRGAGCGPRSAPTRAGGTDRTRRSQSFLSQAGASERAGGLEEVPGPAHICAPRASVWPPRSDVDPPAPDLNRPRSLAGPPRRERPLPLTGRSETHGHPPPSSLARSRGAARLSRDRPTLDRVPAPGGSGMRWPRSRRDGRRGDAGRRRATRPRDRAVAPPRPGLWTRSPQAAAGVSDPAAAAAAD